MKFRYRVLTTWTIWFWMCAVVVLLAGPAGAETLRVLTWPGYADADLVKAFEQRTGAKVEVTFIDSDEQLWQKINQNDARDYDVFAVNTAELQRYLDHGWAVPINLDIVPNIGRLQPQFRVLNSIPGVVRENKVYAVPYTYSEMGLIYDRKQVSPAPQSVQALWDPRYRGRVLLYNGGVHNFSLAVQSMTKRSPFRLDSAEWEPTVQQLIALRRNALTFYSQPDESVNLFRTKGAALMLANYGSQQVKLLKKAGVDVGYAIPREGALAWLDCWVLARGMKNEKLAHAWLDYMLESGPSEALVTRQGLSSTTIAAPTSNDRLVWLEPPEDAERRNLLWERIVSGDSAAKVMAR
jgi:putative spermidine/putrescine transport system substrate-binding protein